MLYRVKGKQKQKVVLSLLEEGGACTDEHLLGFKSVTCLVRYIGE